MFTGTAAAYQDSLNSEPYLIAAALAAVYLMLGILYESYIHPVTILSTLPSAGVGALLGEAYARISRAFGCMACLTNGAVRDLPGIEALGYQIFSGSVAVSHAYAHVVDYGDPVEIGGLRIAPGDLLHGDLHGVHSIPGGAAGDLAGVAEQVLRDDRRLFELTERQDFSPATLSAMLEGVNRQLL